MPGLYKGLDRLKKVFGTDTFEQVLTEVYYRWLYHAHPYPATGHSTRTRGARRIGTGADGYRQDRSLPLADSAEADQRPAASGTRPDHRPHPRACRTDPPDERRPG